jgi:pilus assembly protein Flp/PilA
MLRPQRVEIMKLLQRFFREEGGATAVEYGLLVAVLSLAVAAGVGVFSDRLQTMLGVDFVQALNTHTPG